jgi:hydrogenase/urease accessory protein HupE
MVVGVGRWLAVGAGRATGLFAPVSFVLVQLHSFPFMIPYHVSSTSL